MGGIKVMLPGHDASDNDAHDIAFSSDDSHFNVKTNQTPGHFGVVTYSFSAKPTDPTGGGFVDTVLATIPHGLGYVPAHLVFMFVGTQNTAATMLVGQSYYQLPIALTAAVNAPEFMRSSVDANNLTIYYHVKDNGFASADPTGMNVLFKYYIFAEPS